MTFMTDEWGCLGQDQGNGWIESGDSASWTGQYIYFAKSDYPKITFFEKEPGGYVRHPKPESTYNGFGAYYVSPWRGCLSRDQYTGILLGLIMQNDRKAIKRLLKHRLKTGFLFTNNTLINGKKPSVINEKKIGDFTFMETWGLELRLSENPSLLNWLFCNVFDLWEVINTLNFNYISKGNDHITFLGRLIAKVENNPTMFIFLAFKLLKKQRAVDIGFSYWSTSSPKELDRKQPGMAYLYKNKINELTDWLCK